MFMEGVLMYQQLARSDFTAGLSVAYFGDQKIYIRFASSRRSFDCGEIWRT